MKAYLENLQYILDNGKTAINRTGVDTVASFGMVLRHDLRNGFPLITTKKVNLRKALAEMFGFFKGATTIEEFHKLDCNLWDAWALEEDYYQIDQRTTDELAQALVEVNYPDEKPAPERFYEALRELNDVATNYRDWLEGLTTTLQQNELSPIEYAQVSEKYHRENPAPPTTIEFLESKGIDQYKRTVIASKGDLGPIYGKQWIEWECPDGSVINQVKNVIGMLKANPFDRRLLITGWNPADIANGRNSVNPRGTYITTSKEAVEDNIMRGKMSLPPCHLMNMFMVESQGAGKPLVLNMSVIMRSSDYVVGMPFNLSGYAATLAIIAKQVNMEAGEILIFSNNGHLYTDQITQLLGQLKREPKDLPQLTIPDGIDLTDPETLTIENIDRICENLVGYDPHPFIKYPVAV